MKFKKVYVTMIVKIMKDGRIRPMSMVWEDGATYEIDRVLHITPAASLKENLANAVLIYGALLTDLTNPK